MKKVIIIGSGFAGLSAACFMAKAGWHVTVMEKNEMAGGRARQFKDAGFIFDMGPSWYWMPDVFENFFNQFNKSVDDYYKLTRLDPSYRVYTQNETIDIPANFENLKNLFETIEAGSGIQLEKFLAEASFKYTTAMQKLVWKPGKSVTEFLDIDVIKGVIKLDVFTNMKKHVSRFFKHKTLIELLEFPVLFLGAMPKNIPALYSLMNYADINGGTWYPQGGMYKIVEAMYSLSKELGVKFYFNCNVIAINTNKSKATSVSYEMNGQAQQMDADVIISNADYHFTENHLLQTHQRSYTDAYWNKRTMAPSCLLYYVGLNKKLKNIQHHNLFFDTSFDVHGNEIYDTPQWPTNPLFYVSATSVTDKTIAPDGCENLFFLIPVAAGLEGDTEELRTKYLNNIILRFELRIGEPIKENICYQKSYSIRNFIQDYNSFKGNAYGLANTLKQTAVLKPKCRSKKVNNLFYTGQLTIPGPGVPPSLISGEVVANEVIKIFG